MNAPLPDDLTRALEEAKAGLVVHPHAELVLPKRKKIWAAMGPVVITKRNRAKMTPGLRRRTALAIVTAEHVLPIWERHWDSKDPHRMLEVVRAYVRDEMSWRDARDEQTRFLGALYNANTDEISEDIFHFVYVGYAAVDAVATALKDMDCEDDGTLDEDLDSWDGSFWACSAYSGDFPWEARSDMGRRREFWEWYLDEAVPLAYTAAP
jgi:hypothetical protein